MTETPQLTQLERKEKCSNFLICRTLQTKHMLNDILNIGLANLSDTDYDEEYIQKTITLIYKKVRVFHKYIFNEPRCEVYCLKNDPSQS
jgi:hypothetical protein